MKFRILSRIFLVFVLLLGISEVADAQRYHRGYRRAYRSHHYYRPRPRAVVVVPAPPPRRHYYRRHHRGRGYYARPHYYKRGHYYARPHYRKHYYRY